MDIRRYGHGIVRRAVVLLLTALLLCCSLAGCGHGNRSDEDNTESATESGDMSGTPENNDPGAEVPPPSPSVDLEGTLRNVISCVQNVGWYEVSQEVIEGGKYAGLRVVVDALGNAAEQYRQSIVSQTGEETAQATLVEACAALQSQKGIWPWDGTEDEGGAVIPEVLKTDLDNLLKTVEELTTILSTKNQNLSSDTQNQDTLAEVKSQLVRMEDTINAQSTEISGQKQTIKRLQETLEKSSGIGAWELATGICGILSLLCSIGILVFLLLHPQGEDGDEGIHEERFKKSIEGSHEETLRKIKALEDKLERQTEKIEGISGSLAMLVKQMKEGGGSIGTDSGRRTAAGNYGTGGQGYGSFSGTADWNKSTYERRAEAKPELIKLKRTSTNIGYGNEVRLYVVARQGDFAGYPDNGTPGATQDKLNIWPDSGNLDTVPMRGQNLGKISRQWLYYGAGKDLFDIDPPVPDTTYMNYTVQLQEYAKVEKQGVEYKMTEKGKLKATGIATGRI